MEQKFTTRTATTQNPHISVVVLTDHDTGCEYLLIRDGNSNIVTPRLGADGKPFTGQVAQG